MNLAHKIISQHLVSGEMKPGQEIGLRIDQALTQDITGTMAWLQFEALEAPRVRTHPTVAYIDHNTLQTGFQSADDHNFLRTMAAKYGAYFSRPGNGICHQVHLERFAKPGVTLLGADSHTPNAGGIGALGIGAGGLDVAVAMAGHPFYLTMPKVLRVILRGRLGPWVSPMDVILELLRRRTVKGNVAYLLEYDGEGVATLDVPDRATITNMGAELGATSSIFPSDERTRAFLRAQEREQNWQALAADRDATYDEEVEIDLGSLEPLIACPHSPDNVKPLRELAGQHIDQVCIGSCTNSSYYALMTVAAILRNNVVSSEVSLTISPGSRQVLRMLVGNSNMGDILRGGARLLEAACGPCIGMGQTPGTDAVSIRTFNRNFRGRAGHPSVLVHLASPAVAAASALTGKITDPRTLGEPPVIEAPERYPVDDSLLIPPPPEGTPVEVKRGPNIKPLTLRGPLPETVEMQVLLKVGDNISTDDIMPAGADILLLRSNIPAISEYVFSRIDPQFAARAKEAGSGCVVGGDNYGQGSSREHAALAPMHLGVRAVLAKAFARIHRANLINFGILPLTFVDPADYDRLEAGGRLEIREAAQALREGRETLTVRVAGRSSEVSASRDGFAFEVRHNLTERQREIVLAGGLLNFVKQRGPAGGR